MKRGAVLRRPELTAAAKAAFLTWLGALAVILALRECIGLELGVFLNLALSLPAAAIVGALVYQHRRIARLEQQVDWLMHSQRTDG